MCFEHKTAYFKFFLIISKLDFLSFPPCNIYFFFFFLQYILLKPRIMLEQQRLNERTNVQLHMTDRGRRQEGRLERGIQAQEVRYTGQAFLNFSPRAKELENPEKFHDGVESSSSRSNNCLVFQRTAKKTDSQRHMTPKRVLPWK